MTQFKRIFSQLLRVHPKFRQPLRLPAAITPTVDAVVPDLFPKQAQLGLESTVPNFPPSTDVVLENVEEVDESEDEDEDEACKTPIAMEVQSNETLTDMVPEKIAKVEEFEDVNEYDEYYDDEDEEDIPEVFPYDLARKTRHEMIIQRLYVAVADNDREIAALRTLHREKFTHIVRVVFDPPSRHDNITPSSWSAEETYSIDGPFELRLTCPALALHYGNKLTALKEKQLLAARNYITRALPDRNDAWAAQGYEFPFTPDECEDARVLIVGPTDRSVDVMAILVCYMAFLTGTRADQLLGGLQRLSLVHSHWGGDILGKSSLDMANEVSKKKWKW